MSVGNIMGNSAVACSSDGNAPCQSVKINEVGTCYTHQGGTFSEQ